MKSGTKLDFEAAKTTSTWLTITATDSFSDSASIDVTIMVTDVDEAPKISEGGLAITGSDKRGLRRGQAGRRGNVQRHRAGVGQRHVDTGRRRRWGL